MPRMIPSRPDSDCAASERKVFDRLAAALPAHWTVLHARTIVLPATAKAAATTCEIDFLVIDPARGLLALEVKGGGVQRESDDLWYSIDGSGDAHRIQNPQKQVTRNVYALRDWLRDQPIVAGLFLPIVWAIVLPDVKVASDLGPELPRELIVDQHDLNDAAAAIDRVFSSHSHPQTPPAPRDGSKRGEGPPALQCHPEPAKRGEGSRGHEQRARPLLDPARYKLLIDLLAPTMNLLPLLGNRIADDEAQLVRMTGDQHRIFDFLGGVPRLQVKGPAGSGKTLVAMERARREAAAGKRVLFLCFNALLAEWLRLAATPDGGRTSVRGQSDFSPTAATTPPSTPSSESLRQTGGVRASSPAAAGRPRPAAETPNVPVQQAGSITILTFHDLAKKLAREANLLFKIPAEAKQKQSFWETEVPDLLMRAAEALPDARWDSIVVDEGQDFRELWWLAIERLLSPQSSALSPSLWVFHDPNQDIYGAAALDSLKMQQAELPVNCRNTVRIARSAFAEVGEEPNLAAGAPDGAAVETIRCADEAAMKDAVRTALHRFVNEQKLDPSRITILTASAADKSILKGATLANLKLVDWPAANKNEVGYCSLQRFKGLESDAVIVCEIDRSRSNATPKHLYVAQSRAKHVLVVAEYGDRPLRRSPL